MIFTTSKVRNIKSTKCAGADSGVKYGPCKKINKINFLVGFLEWSSIQDGLQVPTWTTPMNE